MMGQPYGRPPAARTGPREDFPGRGLCRWPRLHRGPAAEGSSRRGFHETGKNRCRGERGTDRCSRLRTTVRDPADVIAALTSTPRLPPRSSRGGRPTVGYLMCDLQGGSQQRTGQRGAGTLPAVCAGCALLAMSGASGARAGLRMFHGRWVTPRRLRVAAITIFIVALGVSSVTLSGSGASSRTACQISASSVAAQPEAATPDVARQASPCQPVKPPAR